MNKKILAVIFIIPFISLIFWTMWLYTQQVTGTEIKVAVMGYDPRDLLSGHYIRYSIDWNRTDCTQFPNGVCPEDEFCKDARWGRECRFYIPEKNARELESPACHNQFFVHQSISLACCFSAGIHRRIKSHMLGSI